MNELDSTPYTIRAFGLTPDGFALARVMDAKAEDIGNGSTAGHSGNITGSGDSLNILRKNNTQSTPGADDLPNIPEPGDPLPRTSMAGRVVLCDGLMPGEIAEVVLDDIGSRLMTSRLVRILKYSPYRVDPFCPVFGRCGGCTCQEITYEALLFEKQRHIRDCLIRIARISPDRADTLLRPIFQAEQPMTYRNNMQYQVRFDESGKIMFGLHTKKSHETITMTRCAIAHPVADLIKDTVEKFLNEPKGHVIRSRIPPDAKLIVRVGTRTGQVLYRLQIPENPDDRASDPSRAGASASNTPERRVATDRRSAERPFAPPDRRKASDYKNSTSFDDNDFSRADSPATARYRLVTVADLDARIRQALRANAPDYTLAQSEIEEQIGPRRYFVSPESFFQVNTDQAERLYDAVLEFFEKANTPSVEAIPENTESEPASSPVVLDLYCGTGSIGLHLSARARRIIGIESSAKTVEDARRNARINAVPNAEFHIGLAEEYDYESLDLQAPLTVVLDPPRKGCAPRLLEKLITLAPNHIIYVSCDPATLARDLRLLIEKGYRPEAAQPVDMFPWTGHVECVVLMSKVQN